jgi:hypothetical protein
MAPWRPERYPLGTARAFSGEIEAWATKSTPPSETRRVVSPSEALGEVDARWQICSFLEGRVERLPAALWSG